MHWHLRLFEFEFRVGHQAGIKQQAAVTPLPLQTDGEDKTDLNNELHFSRLCQRIERNGWKEMGQTSDCEWVAQRDCARTSRHVRVGTTATPFTKPTTSNCLLEQSENLFCLQAVSSVGTAGSNYSYSHNWFLIHVDLTGGAVHEIVPHSLQAHLLRVYPCTRLGRHPAERYMYDITRH